MKVVMWLLQEGRSEGEKRQKAPSEMTMAAPSDGTPVRVELGEGKKNLELGWGVPWEKRICLDTYMD